MMILHVTILALIQGITEFLPISSSGHLVLTHYFLNDGGIMSAIEQKRLDIGVHIGTLLAVIAYFRRDFMSLVQGGMDILCRRTKTKKAHEAFLIIVATIPVLICGMALFIMDMTFFDSLHIIAWMTVIFGVILYIADKKPESSKTVEQFTLKSALFYGLMQCIALIPGVSRSGITMTAGRFLGHSRIEAARFSLMMGMTTIAAAGLLTGASVFSDSEITSDFMMTLVIGVAISFIAAYIAILLMMRFLKQGSFTPFVIYRLILGLALLALLYSGIISENPQIGL